jgi:hypothetical protein
MTDEELKAWAGTWQASVPDTGSLRRRTSRELFWLKVIVAGDLVACIACLCVAAWWLVFDFDALNAALAGLFIVIGLVGLAFTAQNWRGVWQAAGENASDFIALSLRRIAARMRWAWFGGWLLGGELLFFIALIAWRWHTGGDPGRMLFATLLVAILFTLVGAWLLRFWRRERRRRAALEQVAAQLQKED